MIDLPFNPFDRELAELETRELAKLESVAEGWYVEYKREVVELKKIAKSLAAFANHYGGWLFYGIAQSADGSNVAGAFPGIPKSQVADCLERVRNAAKCHMNPAPYYEYKELEGPCPEISLPQDRSVIAIAVPCGPCTPYIHSDGRIYRRIADTSDPKPETDRFILDQLWQHRQLAQDKLKTFLKKTPVLSKGESETSFVHLFLFIDPLGASGQRAELTFDRFRELMSKPQSFGLELSLPFDNFFTMSDGLVCRQIGINSPFNMVLTWGYYSNGSALISIPVSSWRVPLADYSHPSDKVSFFDGYEHGPDTIGYLKGAKYDAGYLLDINNLFFGVSATIAQYGKLAEESGLKGQIYAKAVTENTWRRIPFLDTKSYLRHVAENGFPLIQFDKEFAPPGDTFESLRIIDPNEKLDGLPPGYSVLLKAAPFLADIVHALGVPKEVMFDKSGEWIEAANRAHRISMKRAEDATTS